MIKEGKDTAYLKAKREERGSRYVNDGKILFTDANGGFVTLTKRPKVPGVYKSEDIKYFGKIDILNGMKHTCTCRSFYHGNVEKFLAEHAENFEDKHILGAYSIWNSQRPQVPTILASEGGHNNG